MIIKVITDKTVQEIECDRGESMLFAMKRQDIYVPAYCGGRGTCKKCGVMVIDGELPVTDEDAQAFKADALEAGMRLSCKAYPSGNCTVKLCTDDESAFEILNGGANEISGTADGMALEDEMLGVAVDIGTTTIAMELWGLKSRRMYAQDSRINHQRAFGADVISRILASNSGEMKALQRSILNDICDGLGAMAAQAGIDCGKIARIVVGANTTMEHLLMGYNCETLGVSPFTPVNIHTIHTSLGELLDGNCAKNLPLAAPLILLPGISTFVGADIVAGLLVCGIDQSEKPCMLIDLGTNGEMAIGNKERIISTSTAAGPAFEGGNISHGIGSVRGAICSVSMADGKMTYETIGHAPALGICGTGVLDITAELVDRGLVDETGLLDDDYFDDGVKIADSPGGEPIVFTQQDIREIQLAKAAVRAGIEVLLRRFGVDCEDIDTVYLAGGFGFKIDTKKAMDIGLLPEGFKGKIKVAGNTSLQGARACLFDESQLAAAEKIAAEAGEISLGGDAFFNQCYMDAMCFENEEIV